MSRYTQLAAAAAKEALADSGLDREKEDLTRCGVIVSSGVGGIEMAESEELRCSQKGFDRASPFYIPTTIANMGAGFIAIMAGFQGMCTCPVTACAGGSNAVGDAFRHIRDGYAEVMLCGGAEAAITPLSIGGFTSMRALHVGDDPSRASIPFDAERSGFVMGEGAAVLMLEEYGHAMARGAKIYAEVVGYGATCDAYHITAPPQRGGRRPRHGPGPDRRRGVPRAGGLHQRPRHLHPPQRLRGDRGHQGPCSAPTPPSWPSAPPRP